MTMYSGAGMYVEKNFLRNRDVVAYAKRQAASCLYLEKRMNTWMGFLEKCHRLELVLATLRKVHARQLQELKDTFQWSDSEVLTARPESYYFDEMNARAPATMPDLVIHCVSYQRGAMRYEQLGSKVGWMLMSAVQNDLWRKFERDAINNRDLCETYLMQQHGSGAKALIEEAMDIEFEVMQAIDDRNGAK